MFPTSAWALATLSILLSSLSALSAQESDQVPVFSEVIDVRVVNLEAVVTDNKGVRVDGLGPQDFRLEIDGQDVPIEYFTEVLGGVAVERPSGSKADGVRGLTPGEPVGTSYLLFIDDYFSRSVDRNTVLRSLQEQVGQMRPEDRMAVVAYDGKNLDMLSSWSQSAEALGRVLQRAQSRRAYGLIRAAQFRNFDRLQASGIDDNFRFNAPATFAELNIGEREAAVQLKNDIERVTLAAVSALRGFAGPPGRRVMLLLSGGWPEDPVNWVLSREAGGVVGRELSENLYDRLMETANRLSYTLYPIDLPGMDASGSFLREQEEEFTLSHLAKQTGGQPFLDGARVGAFEKVAEDTRSYYWLGFTPDWKGDDESHTVRLRLTNRALRLRSRESYSDLSRQSEVNMMVESTLLFGDPPSTDPLLVRLGRPEKGGRGRMLVPLSIDIPMNALTFLRAREGLVAEIELRVAVLDEDGDRNEMPIIPLRLLIETEPQEGDLRRYETAIKLRKKKHTLVIALYDYVSGKMLSTKIEVTPG